MSDTWFTEVSGFKSFLNGDNSAQILFTNPDHLITAKFRIRNLNKCVNGKYTWLDIAKTRIQLAPSRMTHKAADAIKLLEEKQADILILRRT